MSSIRRVISFARTGKLGKIEPKQMGSPVHKSGDVCPYRDVRKLRGSFGASLAFARPFIGWFAGFSPCIMASTLSTIVLLAGTRSPTIGRGSTMVCRVMISRRTIVALPLLGAASTALSQTRKARVGIATADTALAYKSVFLEQMAVLGWREGDNLEIVFADALGDPLVLGSLVRRLVDSRPDVIVSSSNRTHFAVRDATTSIPVVAVAALDPIRIGLSDSLSRPSRNFTGNIGFVEELMAKRVELLKEVLPKAQRIGLMLDPNNPAFPATYADADAAARRLGMAIVVIGYSTADEVLPSVDRAAAEKVDALIVAPDAIALSRIRAVAQRAQELRIPALTFNQGDLDSDIPFVLGGDRSLFWREAAGIVDKLLKGASVASIPFSRPTKVYLGVNSRVARTLGIEMPTSILARADEIVD